MTGTANLKKNHVLWLLIISRKSLKNLNKKISESYPGYNMYGWRFPLFAPWWVGQ